MSGGAVLLRGGWVLSLDPRVGNFAAADVLIDEGRILEVGPGLRRRDAEVVDTTDCIVMPGFVDTHRHAWKSLVRNLGDGGPEPGDPVDAAVYGPHHRPDDVYAATLVGLLGAVEAGITTVVDWSDIQLDERYTDATLQAHTDAGLRTVFVHAVPAWAATRRWSRSRSGGPPPSRRAPARAPEDPSTTVAFGPETPTGADLDGFAAEVAAARAAGLRIHVHVGMEPSAQGTVADLADRGLLGDDCTLVHCAQLDGRDLDAVSASGAAVSLTPSSEMSGGSGPPPVQELIDRRIRPGLGVDSERVAPGDLFAQMRAVISLQHATYFDLKLAGKAGLPNLLSTREVIRYATVDGARVAGLGGVTGSLTPGMQADVVVLRADRPNIWPDQRPDRGGGVGHGHLQRRLGVRRRPPPDARRRPRG